MPKVDHEDARAREWKGDSESRVFLSAGSSEAMSENVSGWPNQRRGGCSAVPVNWSANPNKTLFGFAKPPQVSEPACPDLKQKNGCAGPRARQSRRSPPSLSTQICICRSDLMRVAQIPQARSAMMLWMHGGNAARVLFHLPILPHTGTPPRGRLSTGSSK
jgi:hypothetical protein